MNTEKHDQFQAAEDWVVRTFGRRGGTTLLLAGLILIPFAIVLAEYYLDLDSGEEAVSPENRTKVRIAAYVVIWFNLAFVFLGPIAFVIKVPAMLRFIAGETDYRGRWLMAQSVAWILTVGSYVGGITYWYGHQPDLVQALVMPLLGVVIAAFAFYLGAMSTMPHGFFSADRIGRGIHRFVACETTEGVPIRCLFASVVLLLIAIGMVVLPAILFTAA